MFSWLKNTITNCSYVREVLSPQKHLSGSLCNYMYRSSAFPPKTAQITIYTQYKGPERPLMLNIFFLQFLWRGARAPSPFSVPPDTPRPPQKLWLCILKICFEKCPQYSDRKWLLFVCTRSAPSPTLSIQAQFVHLSLPLSPLSPPLPPLSLSLSLSLLKTWALFEIPCV